MCKAEFCEALSVFLSNPFTTLQISPLKSCAFCPNTTQLERDSFGLPKTVYLSDSEARSTHSAIHCPTLLVSSRCASLLALSLTTTIHVIKESKGESGEGRKRPLWESILTSPTINLLICLLLCLGSVCVCVHAGVCVCVCLIML